MNASERQSGFATATVLVVLTGLAVIATALVSFSLNALARAEREITRERLKAGLEEGVATLLPELIDGTLRPGEMRTVTINDVPITIAIANEQAMVDVNAADRDALEERLAGLGPIAAGRVAELALRARTSRTPRPITDLGALARDAGLTPRQAGCLHNQATTLAATADPLSAPRTRRTQMAGAIYRIRARPSRADAPDLGLHVAVLITGMEADPVWFIGRRFERLSLWEACDDPSVK